MVPLGKLALFPGQLRHTNEVMVLLGDNYFALRSASQAAWVAGYLPRTDIATRNSTAVMQEPRDAAEQMEALSRAFARNDESLRERTDEVERLRGTLAEYEELQSTLRTLPERVEHEVMAPAG